MAYSVSDGFPYYIELAKNTDYQQNFLSQENFKFLESISEKQANYRYEPGKWNIKQIIGHVTDHERIMAYRILRFSRKDQTQLDGYDHDMFVTNSRFADLSLKALIADFKKVRGATLSLIESFSEEQLNLKGNVGEFEATIEDFIKATQGHELHHINIIKERYL